MARIRLIVGLTVAVALLASEYVQPAVDGLWKWLLHRSFYQVNLECMSGGRHEMLTNVLPDRPRTLRPSGLSGYIRLSRTTMSTWLSATSLDRRFQSALISVPVEVIFGETALSAYAKCKADSMNLSHTLHHFSPST